MRFRIGVHMGDVIEKDDGTVYGDGVNIAARLQALAEPGGVTVSDAVRGAVRGRVVAEFVDQGEQQVKNIDHPVRAFRVALAGAVAARPPPRRRRPRRCCACPTSPRSRCCPSPT
jgi:adenylate cyclase